MAWVRFERPFDFNPKGQPMVSIVYPVGEFSVTRECKAKALEAGAAVTIATPPRASHEGS